jgi:ankyrin repeat protein
MGLYAHRRFAPAEKGDPRRLKHPSTRLRGMYHGQAMASVHELVARGDVEGLRRLIEAASDPAALVNEVDKDGFTPLFHAVKQTPVDLATVELLLQAGSDPGYVKVNRWEPLSDECIEEFAAMNAELGIDLPAELLDSSPHEYREPLLKEALRTGNVELARLLHANGAVLDYRDEDGYTAVLDAVYGDGDRLPLMRYLLGLGLEVDAVTSYGEAAVSVACNLGQFEVVAELLRAGADESRLAWTPLHRAVTVGNAEDVALELMRAPEVDAFDRYDRTALQLAAFKGDWPTIEALLLAGADPFRRAEDGLAALGQAALGKHNDLVLRLLELGGSQRDKDEALKIAVEQSDVASARLLLQAGANASQRSDYDTLLENAVDGEIVRLLLEYGADLNDLETEGRRLLVGLPERDEHALDGVTREEYLAHRYPRAGTANPEEMSDPFRLAMIRSGFNAYWARKTFDDPAVLVCGPVESRPSPVWCFDRFGQSTTILPDGRIVLIAGEHEDYYDPDFCIYNDVSVFDPDGGIRVYGYPYGVFPPTDFHSATLVGDWIYLIGSLGYMGVRQGPIPVWRLSTLDFRMEPLLTTGDRPGRIFKHRATLIDRTKIRIHGGKLISFKKRGFLKKDPEEVHGPNPDTFELDLRSMAWTKV